MSANALYCALFASGFPFAAIGAIIGHYFLRRAAWRRKRRRGEKNPGFCPSASALGMAMLFLQIFVRPSLQHVLSEVQEEDKDEDDEGDLETNKQHFQRQLKRIRRGEDVGDITFRM